MTTNLTVTEPPAPNILVVDDEPANLRLLVEMLKKRGYKPRPVICGELALRAARQLAPDLVLLDINMPDMNGYQVCEHFKADPQLQDIPILFLSAMNSPDDKLKAFQHGAVDFVTKPFFFDEVEARVRAHLELRRQRRELAESYQRLKELEALRDNLTHMIVHDMRTPLFTIELALSFNKPVAKTGTDSAESNVRDSALKSVGRLKTMTTQMLDISRLEAGQMPLSRKAGDLAQTVRSAMDSIKDAAPQLRYEFDAPEPVPAVYDPEVLHRVVCNLVGNAQKFSPPTGEVRVSIRRVDEVARVEVADQGPGIAAAQHDRIFEKFSQVDPTLKKRGAGLGLTFCKLAINTHSGTIGLQSEPGKGSVFWFTLPISEAPTLSSAN
jgi:signal transduction histidine kinase